MTALLHAIGLVLTTAAAVSWVRERRRRRGLAEAVARAGHELRGPLHAAGMALWAVRRESSGAAAAGCVDAVDVELARAARALEDLDAAASGRPPLPCAGEPVDVAALLARQLPAWRALARAAGRTVVVRAEPGLVRPVVHADRGRLAQATSNLVANAIEHGAGQIVVRLRAGRGGRLVVEVSDGGEGLPAPVELLVARPRAGRGRRGRGLAIASAAAVACGGRLAAAPSAAGARLTLDLPLLDGLAVPVAEPAVRA